jgi:hypothetical protein
MTIILFKVVNVGSLETERILIDNTLHTRIILTDFFKERKIPGAVILRSSKACNEGPLRENIANPDIRVSPSEC